MIKSYLCYNCQHRNKIDVCSKCSNGSEFLSKASRRTYVSYNSIADRYKSHSLIKKVIFNDPATIVFWSDGTKTVVKRAVEYEDFDPEKGLAMAICKKMLGDGYYRIIKKYTDAVVVHVEHPRPPHLDDSLVPGFVCDDAAKAMQRLRDAFRSFNG